jgi:hypothetical protein
MFIIGSTIAAQDILASIQTGETVILHSDGTWEYQNHDVITQNIPESINQYYTPKEADKFISNGYVTANLWYDSKKRKYQRTGNLPLEYYLIFSAGDLYVGFMSEEIQIYIQNLHENLIEKGRNGGTNFVILKDEIRKVNDIAMGYLEFKFYLKGTIWVYTYDYWSGEKGNVVVYAVTSENLYQKKKPDIDNILNGLVIIE